MAKHRLFLTKIESVGLVDSPANKDCQVMLFKRDEMADKELSAAGVSARDQAFAAIRRQAWQIMKGDVRMTEAAAIAQVAHTHGDLREAYEKASAAQSFFGPRGEFLGHSEPATVDTGSPTAGKSWAQIRASARRQSAEAWGEIETAAKRLCMAEPGLSPSQAVVKVIQRDPELKQRYFGTRAA